MGLLYLYLYLFIINIIHKSSYKFNGYSSHILKNHEIFSIEFRKILKYQISYESVQQ